MSGMTICSPPSSWNSNAYKEYYAIVTGAAPPKPKASVQRTRSSSDTSITPLTAIGPRLTTFQKGKQAAKAFKAKILYALSEVAMTEAQQLKLVTKRSMRHMHISQASGSGADEGTGSIPGVLDALTDESKEELSWNSTDDEGADDQGKDGDDDEEHEGDGNLFEFMQMNQFARAVSAILGIVQQYMDQRMNEIVKVAVQIQSDRLRDEAQRDNDEFLKTVDENMQKIIKEQTSYVLAYDLLEMELKKILIEKMEGNRSIQRSDEQRNPYKALVEAYESDKIILYTYEETVTLKRRRDDDADKDEEPSAGPDRGSKRRREGKEPESASAPTKTTTRSAGSIQPWISELAKQADTGSSFNKLMDTPLDFSNFLINRLKVDTLTSELLAGPAYELMKVSCKSLVELGYHLEEVLKATTDQLDWVNPKGQQYPHNLLKPLPLIPNNRGRRVIPFEHFINNDLEYLRRGASSCKYTTSITKTKAADYAHIKWMEDLLPRTMWIEEPIGYDKHALWGRRVDDLQLRVESYQKKLNLTKLDSYRSDLKRKEAYTAYSNPWGFIYQNKDKRNRLMRIDELHKFSDGTLTDVRTALDDRLKGIRMQYLTQSIWRKSDKDRACP
uniref:Uncharacterized protein n=1 Tax=Tanacetum cinerariifolium TaxID=118510 RepID=A0A6L2LMK6_TANCI|nr:hypothetical protein [Tanacetum cinerariifolium]